MKKSILFIVVIICFIMNNLHSQILEIPYTGNQVTVVVSGSIFQNNGTPALHDHIYGLVLLYTTNEQDGSAAEGKILHGTHYYKSNPDTVTFTSNSNTHSLFVFALDYQYQNIAPLQGAYNVKVNNTTYSIVDTNVVYLLPCNTISLGNPITNSIFDSPSLQNIQIHQNYPNPFSSSTSIDFYIEKASNVELSIYDNTGKLMNSLVNGKLAAGEHTITWNGDDTDGNILPPGNYFYHLSVDGTTQARKMILLR